MVLRCGIVEVFKVYSVVYHQLSLELKIMAMHRKQTVLKKVKCPLVQALRLCTGRTAHRGSRGIVLPFRDHGTGSG